MNWDATLRVFWALFGAYLAGMVVLGMILAPIVMLAWEMVR